MERIITSVQLGNPLLKEMVAVRLRAVVDVSRVHLCLPAALVGELGLICRDFRWVIGSDGERQKCRYVGPLMVRFADRAGFVGAVEFGSEVVLGSIPMDEMGLAINVEGSVVIANPIHSQNAVILSGVSPRTQSKDLPTSKVYSTWEGSSTALHSAQDDSTLLR